MGSSPIVRIYFAIFLKTKALIIRKPNLIKMEKFIDDFVAFLRARSSSIATVRGYQQTMHHFFSIIKKQPSAVTQEDIIRYISRLDSELIVKSKGWERKRTSLSNASKQTFYSAFSSFFKYHRNLELVEQIKELRKKGSRRGERIPVKISEDEARAMIEAPIAQNKALNERNALIIKFFYATGVRNGELQKIMIADLPLKALPLPQTFALDIVGKGSVQRTIIIPKWLMQEIKEFYDNFHKGISPYLFYSKKGDFLTTNQIWSIVKNKARMASIPEKNVNSVLVNGIALYPHGLRSTFATNLSESGENLLKIQTILGHASPETTRRYVRISKSELQKMKLPENPEAKK
jgi:integrase/recombinase XerC